LKRYGCLTLAIDIFNRNVFVPLWPKRLIGSECALSRTAFQQISSLRRGFLDALQLAFSTQINPLAAVQQVPQAPRASWWCSVIILHIYADIRLEIWVYDKCDTWFCAIENVRQW
jgi:hypothetical protein